MFLSDRRTSTCPGTGPLQSIARQGDAPGIPRESGGRTCRAWRWGKVYAIRRSRRARVLVLFGLVRWRWRRLLQVAAEDGAPERASSPRPGHGETDLSVLVAHDVHHVARALHPFADG